MLQRKLVVQHVSDTQRPQVQLPDSEPKVHMALYGLAEELDAG